MVYVDVSFDCGKTITTKEFQTPQMALRFLYLCRRKCFFVMSYRADDPFDYQWIERRFKL